MKGSKFMWKSGVFGVLLGLGEFSIYANIQDLDSKTFLALEYNDFSTKE